MIALVPALTSSTSASPIIVTDSNHADTRAAWHMFDGLSGDMNVWYPGPIPVTNNPQSAVVDFGAVTHIDAYSITNGPNDPVSYSPKIWALSGSNDGTNYTTIDSRTESWGGVSQTKQYDCSASYRYYKLTISGSSAVYVFVDEMQFYVAEATATRRRVTL